MGHYFSYIEHFCGCDEAVSSTFVGCFSVAEQFPNLFAYMVEQGRNYKYNQDAACCSQYKEGGVAGCIEVSDKVEVGRAGKYLLMGEVGGQTACSQPVNQAVAKVEAGKVEYEAGRVGNYKGIGVGRHERGGVGVMQGLEPKVQPVKHSKPNGVAGKQ